MLLVLSILDRFLLGAILLLRSQNLGGMEGGKRVLYSQSATRQAALFTDLQSSLYSSKSEQVVEIESLLLMKKQPAVCQASVRHELVVFVVLQAASRHVKVLVFSQSNRSKYPKP